MAIITGVNPLRAFASQYFPKKYVDQILAEIQQTGDISDETLKKAGIGKRSTIDFIRSQVKEIAPKTSINELSQTQLKALVGDPSQVGTENVVDEANLDDEGLSTRRSIYDQLGKTKGQLDTGTIQRSFEEKLKAYNVHGESVPTVAKALADITSQLGRYPTAEEFRQNYAGLISPQLDNFFNAQDPRNEFSSTIQSQLSAPDTFEDIKRIEDLLSSRSTQRANEAEVTSHLDQLRGQLGNSRNSYMDALAEQENVRLQEAVPQHLATLNARGALFSGDVGDVLSTEFGNSQSLIENERATLEADDNQFYFQAAYQNALRKQLEGQQDYKGFLENERSRVLNEQNSRFQKSQQEVSAYAQNDLQMRQYNQALKAQQIQLQRQRDAAAKANRAGLFSGLGQAGGAVAGGIIGGVMTGGNPLGIAAGASIGGGTGGGLGGVAGS